jgi:hypothetical protein
MLDPQRVPIGFATDTFVAATKAAPSVAVVSASAAGVPLQHWVMIATLAFVLLQTAHLLFRWGRELRDDRRRDAAMRESDRG